jgi:peptide/nickel transport system permease protein
MLLVGAALAAAIPLGMLVGVAQAAWRARGDRRGRAADRALGVATLVAHSVPEYWLALGALALLAYRIPLFPVGGMLDAVSYDYLTTGERIVDRLRHLVLPASVLALAALATVARHQRAALVEALGEDHVRTARAKGVPERAVLARHALRNALVPVITLLGLALPALVGGAVFVERVFAWPGMGLAAVQGVEARDYPLVTASVVVGSALVALGALAADLLHAWADPRVRDGLAERGRRP